MSLSNDIEVSTLDPSPFTLHSTFSVLNSKFLLLSFFILSLVGGIWGQAITSAGSGNWNSTTPNAPWPSGVVPTVGSTVTIAAGHTVTLNANTASLGSLTVNGVLTNDGNARDVALSATSGTPFNLGASGVFSSGGFIRILYTTTGTQATGTATNNLTFPGLTGVSTLTKIEAWGAGGGGASARSNAGSGGGGGGYASIGSVSITAGTSYTLNIGVGGAGGATGNPANPGNTGSTTTANFPTTVVASGGGGGAINRGTVGSGGSGTAGSGITTFTGGSGSVGSTTAGSLSSGAGGGGAGSTANGSAPLAASLGTGGLGGSINGGNGGNGATTAGAAGGSGNSFGGGGGGGYSTANNSQPAGGSGACGAFGITYTTSSAFADNTVVSASNVCGGTTNNVIHRFSITPSNGRILIAGPISFQTGAQWVTGDVTNFKLYSSSTNDFSTASLLSTISSPTGTNSQSFSFTSFTATAVIYFWITIDVPANTTANNKITISGLTQSNFSNCIPLPTGSNSSSGTQTLLVGPTANAGSAISAICQSATSAALGGSVGGSATGGTWTENGTGSINNPTDIANATYTAGAGETGSVTLTLTTSGGSCGTTTATKTITINPNPTADAGAALTAICQSATSAQMGGSVGGGATGGTWSGGAGSWTNANNPSTATYTAGPSESGTITLTLTTSGGSCGTTTATKDITVNTIPSSVSVTGGGDICPDGTATLNATGGTGGTIYWQGSNSNGTSTATPSSSESVSSSGTYYFRAENQGCWGTQGSATVTVIQCYVSSTVAQDEVNAVSANTTNNEIISIQITMNGSTSPLNATSFTINTTGTTSVSDISNAKLWYTGTSSTFATTTQFGSTNASPSGSFNITGTQALSDGVNYFWLTYDITSGATAGNVVDAQCTSITIGGVARTPTETAPTGTRTIAQIKTWNGVGKSGGTGGTDFNDGANWVPTGVPSSTDNLVISLNENTTSTISLSGNITVNSITYTDATAITTSQKTHSLSIGNNTLTVNGNVTVTNSFTGSVGGFQIINIGTSGTLNILGDLNITTSNSGATGTNVIQIQNTGNMSVGGNTLAKCLNTSTNQIQFGTGNSPSTTTFNGNVTLDDGTSTSVGTVFINTTGTGGVTTGTFKFLGNVSFGARVATSATNIPGTYLFDGTGTQSWTNNSSGMTTISSIKIGETNSPTVNFSGTAITLNSALAAGVTSNLTINNDAVLDLGTITLNRAASATGVFELNNNATIRIGGTQTFPSNYTTRTLSTTSNTVYYGAAQTVAGLTYGNLTLQNSSAGTKTLGAATNVAGTLTVKTGSTLALSTFTLGATTAPTSVVLENGTTGSTISGSGTLTLGGNITVNTPSGTGTGATISCPVALGANRTITVSSASATADLAMSGIISGTGFGITKEGSGVLRLSGVNTYTGTTAVNTGTLTLGTGTERISNSSALTVASGATFDLATFSETVGSISGAGTITSASGTPTLSCGADNSSTTFSGLITGTIILTKQGTGKLILTGANTYTGLTTISAGVLNIQNADALGTTAAGVSITAGAALQVEGGITIGNEALSIRGAGISSDGALRFISGNNSWGGLITQVAASRINTDAGTSTIDVTSGNAITGTFNLTIGGAGNLTISDPIATSTGTLTKDGEGKLTLTGTNTYSGLTTISAGVLNIQNAQGTGTTGGGVTVASGAALELEGGITVGAEALTINNAGILNAGSLRNISGDNTWGGTVTLSTNAARINSDAGTLTLSAANSITATAIGLTIGGAGNTSVSGTITTTTGSVTKDGSGTLTVSGANTYSGATTINNGTLKLGSAGGATNTPLGTTGAGTTVSSGATLDLAGYTLGTAEALTISGTGVSSSGALMNSGSAATYSGLITLGASSSIIGGTGTIAISNVGTITGSGFGLTLGGAQGGSIASIIGTESGTLTKEGNGLWTLSGANTYTGTTTVSSGTLALGSANERISNSSALTISSGATFAMAGFSETVASISGAGTISSASGTPTLTCGGNDSSTEFSGVIGTGAINLTKTGSGTLTLSGSSPNTHTGGVTLSAGKLNLNKATALGGAAGTFTISNATTIDNTSGSSITISNNNPQAWNGDFTFNGTNELNLGTGNVSMNADRAITITANSLNVGGTINDNTKSLTKAGAGTLAFGSQAVTLNALTISAGSLTSTSGELSLKGTFTNNATFTHNSGTVAFTGTSGQQTIGGSRRTTFHNFRIDNTAGVKPSVDMAVNGQLNLNVANPDATNGLLDLVQSYVRGGKDYAQGTKVGDANTSSLNDYNNLDSKVLYLGSSSTMLGSADVTGKIRRTSFTDGATYTFGNVNMQLTFQANGSALPDSVTVIATRGTRGLHIDKDGTSDYTPGSSDTLIGGQAVKRLWQVMKNGGGSGVKFTVRFPYDDSEIPISDVSSENDFVIWDHHLPYAGRTPHEHGQTNRNTTANWIELTGHGIGYMATEGSATFTKYWMISKKIIQLPTWLGAAGGGSSGDWNAVSNWSTGAVPIAGQSILIPSSAATPNDPLATTMPASISLATIEIQSGGILDGSNSTITLTGGPAVNGGRSTFQNNGKFTPGNGSIVIDYSDGTISGNATFNNLKVNAGKKVTIQASSNDTIQGTLEIDGTFDLNGNPLVFKSGATLQNDGTFSNVTKKVTFLGAGTITGANQSTFEDVTLNGALTVTTSPTVNDTLTMKTGSSVLTNGISYGGSSTLLYDGTTQSTTNEWTGTSIPNSVGVINSTNLTLSGARKVPGIFTLNNGQVNTTSSNILEIGSNASSVGSVSWTSGTVKGPMKRWFGTTANPATQESGIFPIGADLGGTKGITNRYAQVNFTSNPAGGYIIAEYKTGLPGNSYAGLPLNYSSGSYPQAIQNAEEEGYWDITPYSSGGVIYGALDNTPYTLKLRLQNPSTLTTGWTPSNDGNDLYDPGTIRLIRAKGSISGTHGDWELAGSHVSASGNSTTGDYYLTSELITGFSWFNGGGNNQNPLPVELVSFSGICEDGIINLTWQTASEQNSSHFDVEKSRDGENWQVISTITSAGTSNQLLTYQTMDQNATDGNNYFRLRQVDIDGAEKLYDPINVSCSEVTTGYFSSFPNPSGSSFQVIVNNKDLIGDCILNISDASGKIVETREIDVKEGINMFVVNQELTSGIYFLSVTNGTKSTPMIRHAIK